MKNWFSGHGKPILGKTKLVPCVGGLLGASRILPALSTQLKNWFPVQSVLKTRFSEFFFGLPLRRPGFPFFSEPGPRMVLRIGFGVRNGFSRLHRESCCWSGVFWRIGFRCEDSVFRAFNRFSVAKTRFSELFRARTLSSKKWFLAWAAELLSVAVACWLKCFEIYWRLWIPFCL